MYFTVYLAIFGSIPAILAMFAFLRPYRAIMWAYLLSALFLPIAGFEFPGIPNIDKNSAPNLAVLLSICIFDPARFGLARIRWFDLPMLLFLFSHFVSSITNNIGNSPLNSVYGGWTLAQNILFVWGIPYFVARLYLDSYERFVELMQIIFVGGLIYVPLCLLEVRFSPQLHTWIYGFHQHSFLQSIRLNGFRPTVFMQHGLGVGMWMTLTSLVGVTLWRVKKLPRFTKEFEIPIVALILLSTVLVKSTGAILLLFVGLLIHATGSLFRNRLVYILILVAPIAYCVLRVSGLWKGEILSEWMGGVLEQERIESMLGRMWNEELLIQHALEKPWFGWSGWDRSSVYDEEGRRLTTQDGMWIIAFGVTGYVGLVGFLGTFLLPALGVFAGNQKRKDDIEKHTLCYMAALCLCLLALDFLMNAMPNPIYMLLCGGLSNVAFLSVNRVKFDLPQSMLTHVA